MVDDVFDSGFVTSGAMLCGPILSGETLVGGSGAGN